MLRQEAGTGNAHMEVPIPVDSNSIKLKTSPEKVKQMRVHEGPDWPQMVGCLSGHMTPSSITPQVPKEQWGHPPLYMRCVNTGKIAK